VCVLYVCVFVCGGGGVRVWVWGVGVCVCMCVYVESELLSKSYCFHTIILWSWFPNLISFH